MSGNHVVTTCRFCGDRIRLVDGVWRDITDGDVCSGDDDLTNENQPHRP